VTSHPRRYEVLVEPAARRTLSKLPQPVRARLVQRMETLATNPRPVGAVKLAGHNAYRVRVGDYRIIYSIIDDRLLILIVDVGHRRDVYRSW
jgi:mRNA interferase RelE/StbE